MTVSGWVLLILSWSVIIGLCGYCVVKVLLTQRANIHAPLDIDTGDLAESGERRR